jgi:3-oxoacyl-[acyl-carrier-protein] synthase II
MSTRKRVAITGMGVISSLGNSPDTLHASLCDQQHIGHLRIAEYAAHGLPARQGGSIASFRAEEYLNGRLLRPLDRTGRLVAAAAGLALADSAWNCESLAAHEVGLVLGTMFSSMHTIAQFDFQALTNGPSCASPMDFANTVINSGAGQSAIWHRLRGINSTIATGATSGLMAMGYASDLIAHGGQTAILAGGADEFCFESFCACERAGLLHEVADKEGCAVPFDARRNGFALTEASALLMLEEWDFAVARGARIRGEVIGHGSAYDRSLSSACGRAMVLAMQDAGVRPEDIDLVSASANGSISGDHSEAVAIQQTLQRHKPVPIMCVKSLLGESLGSAGAVQAIALLESLRTSTVPGVHGLEQVDPQCAALDITPETRKRQAQCGLISSIAFDCSACSLILRLPQPRVSGGRCV